MVKLGHYALRIAAALVGEILHLTGVAAGEPLWPSVELGKLLGAHHATQIEP